MSHFHFQLLMTVADFAVVGWMVLDQIKRNGKLSTDQKFIAPILLAFLQFTVWMPTK